MTIYRRTQRARQYTGGDREQNNVQRETESNKIYRGENIMRCRERKKIYRGTTRARQ